MHDEHPNIVKVWADQGYQREFEDTVKQELGIDVEISRNAEMTKGFVPIYQRWKVERTFDWWNWERRLSKDYERRLDTTEAFIDIAMSDIMLSNLS